MKYILFYLLIFFTFSVFPQCDGRYENEIFDVVNKTIVEYTDVYDWSSFDSGLDMDIYQPVGDSLSNRPVIIFMHTGAFFSGHNELDDVVDLLVICFDASD